MICYEDKFIRNEILFHKNEVKLQGEKQGAFLALSKKNFFAKF